MTDTLLVISGCGIPPWSCRGARQNLTPDVDAQMERDVNGSLKDIPLPASFQKLRTSISCEDVAAPAFGDLVYGQQIVISCIQERGIPITLAAGVGSATLPRDAVAGTGRAVAATGAQASATLSGTGNRTAAVDFGDGSLSGQAWIYYRPILTCRVENWTCDFDEWAATYNWSLDAREI